MSQPYSPSTLHSPNSIDQMPSLVNDWTKNSGHYCSVSYRKLAWIARILAAAAIAFTWWWLVMQTWWSKIDFNDYGRFLFFHGLPSIDWDQRWYCAVSDSFQWQKKMEKRKKEPDFSTALPEILLFHSLGFGFLVCTTNKGVWGCLQEDREKKRGWQRNGKV